MMSTNPYGAYEQGSVLSSESPMQLIIALYEGGISAVQEAERRLEARDIMARAKAITKASNIVAELRFSLKRDAADSEGLTANLSRLYDYMLRRLLEANMKQTAEPLVEVEGLLRTMLEGWNVVAEREKTAAATQAIEHTQPELTAGGSRISYGA